MGNIEIGSIYANCNQSVAVSLDQNALYIWGTKEKFNEDAHKYLPEKMESFNDSKIVSVGLGSSFIGFLCESKEEFKETEYVLKSGEEITVQNKMNDVENRMAHQMYVKNQELFGNDDWIEIRQRYNYSLFSYFGHEFVDNLVMNKEQTMIELIEHSEIDSIYHSDIIGSMFFVSLDALNIIKTDRQKKEFWIMHRIIHLIKLKRLHSKYQKNKRMMILRMKMIKMIRTILNLIMI